MERRSHLSRAIASADDKVKYDAYVAVLSSDLSAERKEQLLEQGFGIMPTIQRKGDMEEMCNLSSGLIEKGEKIGFERGIKTTAQRAYERFGSYEIAASLADVSVEEVKKWLSHKDASNNTDM